MERAVAAVVADKGWAKAEWKLPEKGHLVRRSKNATGWESSVFLPFAHLYLCPCRSIFAYLYINAEGGMLVRFPNLLLEVETLILVGEPEHIAFSIDICMQMWKDRDTNTDEQNGVIHLIPTQLHSCSS